jgi:hypothetical protein
MNPVTLFSTLVAQTMARATNLDYNAAARLTAQSHPGLAVLASACGKTQASVQFVNSRFNRAPKTAAARERFQKEVQRTMDEDHCDYGTAFNRVEKKATQFVNSDDLKAVQAAANGSGGMPQRTPALLDIFRLPPDTTPQEFSAAWNGNDKTATTINYGKVFSSLASLTQSQKGMDIDSAIAPTKERFRQLWSAVEELAKLSF